MQSNFPWAYYNRGLTNHKLGKFDLAIADFDQVVYLYPNFDDTFVNRALANAALQNYADAIRDLDQALIIGRQRTRVFFIRGRIKSLAKDEEGAKADYEAGMREKPQNERDWLARAWARANTPEDALHDYLKALDYNPKSQSALRGAAHFYNVLKKYDHCLDMLNRLLNLNPDHQPA